jgi:hypothetical protein
LGSTATITLTEHCSIDTSFHRQSLLSNFQGHRDGLQVQGKVAPELVEGNLSHGYLKKQRVLQNQPEEPMLDGQRLKSQN